MKPEYLIGRLRQNAVWADANKNWVPITMAEELTEAADLLEKLTDPTGIDELGLSTRAYSALYRRGYRLAREIMGFTVEEFAKIPGIGKGTAQEIFEKVKEAMNG